MAWIILKKPNNLVSYSDELKNSENYISGEEISRVLKISRAGIWKHMQELRDLGYDIAAVPHLGYKLVKTPDRLYPWEVKHGLKTKLLGKQVDYHDKVSSTMDAAWDIGRSESLEGGVVCAEYQSKGRGRQKRPWVSQKFKGLYFSIILKPDIAPAKIPCITLLSAVAVVAAVKKMTSLSLSIKWPNDILIGKEKLAGILTELNAEQDRANFEGVGIGINVNNKPQELVEGAVSLRSALNRKTDRVRLLKVILEEFERVYLDFKKNGPALMIDEWRKHSYIWGSKVKVVYPKTEIKGEAVDLDSDGALLVRKSSGVI